MAQAPAGQTRAMVPWRGAPRAAGAAATASANAAVTKVVSCCSCTCRKVSQEISHFSGCFVLLQKKKYKSPPFLWTVSILQAMGCMREKFLGLYLIPHYPLVIFCRAGPMACEIGRAPIALGPHWLRRGERASTRGTQANEFQPHALGHGHPHPRGHRIHSHPRRPPLPYRPIPHHPIIFTPAGTNTIGTPLSPPTTFRIPRHPLTPHTVASTASLQLKLSPLASVCWVSSWRNC